LFLFTEGIVEAVDANGRKLGEKHLRGMSLQAVKLNAKAQPFYDNIIQAICGFTGNIPQADDLTFMIIGRKNSQKTT
jgi:serine phosphatase RsbU (regulator of sigma subunit)